MVNFFDQYTKYLFKYHNTKIPNNKNIKILNGGGKMNGFYSHNNKIYKSYKTFNGNFYSFYELPFNELEKSIKTQNLKAPQPNKVLIIDSIFLFDWFTSKYGKNFDDEGEVFISWDLVQNDYKGFYLDHSNVDLKIQRHDNLIFKRNYCPSWWNNFDIINVMMFR